MISIVNYGRGNIYSIQNALTFCNIKHSLAQHPDDIVNADKLLLPGVGAFADAMRLLKKNHLDEAIIQAAKKGTSILGICVGMQVFFDQSDEFELCDGLKLIPGKITKIPATCSNGTPDRIPNVGWRIVNPTPTSAFGGRLDQQHHVYFTHSFGAVNMRGDALKSTITVNDTVVAAAVQNDNITALQFHPEKSATIGLEYFKVFNRI